MTPATFIRNDVLADEDGRLHRLLKVDFDTEKNTDDAWLISLGEPLALPVWHQYSALGDFFSATTQEAMPESGEGAATPRLRALPRPISDASSELSKRAWKRIEPLVNLPGILERSTRATLLKKRANEPCTDPSRSNGTEKTLLKDLRAYWQGGQTPAALSGNYAKCGRPSTVGTGARGRPRKDGPTYQCSKEDHALMRQAIEEFYLCKKNYRSLTDALTELHERHYTFQDGNNETQLLPASECPSLRQLAYFLKTNYPLETRLRRRKGDKEFERNHRSTEGSVQLDCHGVGHMYEFDATIVDVYLVSEADRNAIVGKPTMYLIIDRASRLIVGWYIGFEHACYSAAMQAILSIGEDKRQLCKELGIAYDPLDWLAHLILPELFLADQGELGSKDGGRIANSIRCILAHVPGLRPDWKPLVECGFKLLHQVIRAIMPGFSPDADTMQRRAQHHDQQAALTLKEFTSVIVKAIITHNKTMQRGYPLSVAQVARGVAPVPRELWADGIRNRMGLLDRMDFEKVRADLMPRDKAVIEANGIRFKQCLYSCPEAISRGWLVEGRVKRKDVNVAFDYRLADEIIVYAPDRSGDSCVAYLTKDSVQFQGMAFADIQRHFAALAQLTRPASEEKRQAKFEYRKHVKPIIDRAVAETARVAKGVSRSSRKADTAAERASELFAERSASAGVRHISGAVTPPPTMGASRGQIAAVIPIRGVAEERGAATSAQHQPASHAAPPSDSTSAPRKPALQELLSAFRGRL